MVEDRFTSLPDGCIEMILCHLSPRELCATALAGNRELQAVADSNLMWERFLPQNYLERVVYPQPPLFASTKMFYYWLSTHPLVLDHGRLIFSGDWKSGKNSYLVGALELQIDTQNVWEWQALGNESRFNDVCVLMETGDSLFECRVESCLLSDDTKYAAYLIFKIADGGFGFSSIPVSAAVTYIKEKGGNDVGDDVVNDVVDDVDDDEDMNDSDNSERDPDDGCFFYLVVGEQIGENVNLPSQRDDGWMEVKMAEFSINHDYVECDVKINVCQEDYPPMHGLIIEGIEFRPII